MIDMQFSMFAFHDILAGPYFALNEAMRICRRLGAHSVWLLCATNSANIFYNTPPKLNPYVYEYI